MNEKLHNILIDLVRKLASLIENTSDSDEFFEKAADLLLETEKKIIDLFKK